MEQRAAQEPESPAGERAAREPAGAADADARRRRTAGWLIAAGVVLVALNLRPAVAGTGPLLEEIRADLHMGGTVAGLLTSLPTVCFAVFGSLGPVVARRVGRNAVLVAAMAALALGLALRAVAGNTYVFLAATMLGTAGIAVSNVLLPALVKQEFPKRVALMTGVYSMCLAGGTAAAAALAVPLEHAFGGGWRPALAFWAGLAVLALLPWLVVLVTERRRGGKASAPPAPGAGNGAAGTGGAESGTRAGKGPAIWRSPTAWALTLFFGVQSSAAYTAMGWAPQIFRDAGISAGAAGNLLAIIQLVGVPMSFVIPALAGRLRDQRPIVAVLVAAGLAGYAGLAFAPAAAPLLWALLIGVMNSCFPLALIMIGMRARTGTGVGRLSSFTQSVGYLVSVPVPILVGALYQATGGWGVPLALLAALMVPQLTFGLLAGRNRYVEDELAARSGA